MVACWLAIVGRIWKQLLGVKAFVVLTDRWAENSAAHSYVLLGWDRARILETGLCVLAAYHYAHSDLGL